MTEPNVTDIPDAIEEGVEPLLNVAGTEEEQLTHTLLEMWEEILSHAETEKKAQVLPSEALRILQQWPMLTARELPAFYEEFYRLLGRGLYHVQKVREKYPEHVNHVDDDAEFNHDAYVEVLQLWTEEINTAQQTWHLQMQYPMANAAALANASGFLVGDTGLVAHLDAIGFELTDEDKEQLRKGDDE